MQKVALGLTMADRTYIESLISARSSVYLAEVHNLFWEEHIVLVSVASNQRSMLLIIVTYRHNAAMQEFGKPG